MVKVDKSNQMGSNPYTDECEIPLKSKSSLDGQNNTLTK